MRTPGNYFSTYPAVVTGFIVLVGLSVFFSPQESGAQSAIAPQAAPLGALVHRAHAIPVAVLHPAAAQDAGQAAPAAAAPSAPKPVDLPEGDGKPIATEYCQMCHKLTNLTKAHKNLDDWKDTIQTMIERGASIPDDKVDTLAKYLAANFGPKDAAPAANSQAAAPATSASSSDPPAPSTAAPAPATATAVVELPDGDGKAIATENCQACHKLTNLTKAHKSLDDWKDTVQTMIDRGANVPADQIDTLVQYLAKNFGPKDASAPASVAPPTSTPAQ